MLKVSITLTDAQKEKMLHALGLTRRGVKSFRNHYGLYEPDPSWEELVTNGLAIKYKSAINPEMTFYSVTSQGAMKLLGSQWKRRFNNGSLDKHLPESKVLCVPS